MMAKHYDRAYFDRWYRKFAVAEPASLTRKVALAVATAEYHLQRPIRTVLDIGCGEGAWRAPLLKLRPKLHYLGFDHSAYAVARYGRTRGLHRARFSDFATLRPCPPADLLVCSDVLHYLDTREIDRGLPGLTALCGGVAYLETFTRQDAIEGDRGNFKPRSAKAYVDRFTRVGFVPLGSHCWLSIALRDETIALEVPCRTLRRAARS